MPEDGGTDTITATLSPGHAIPVTINLIHRLGSRRLRTTRRRQLRSRFSPATPRAPIVLTGVDTSSTSDQTTVGIQEVSVRQASSATPSVTATLTGDPTSTCRNQPHRSPTSAGPTRPRPHLPCLRHCGGDRLWVSAARPRRARLIRRLQASFDHDFAPGSTTGTITLTGIDTGSTSATPGRSESTASARRAPSASTTSGTTTLTGNSHRDTCLEAVRINPALRWPKDGGVDTIRPPLSQATNVMVTIDLGFSGSATTNQLNHFGVGQFDHDRRRQHHGLALPSTSASIRPARQQPEHCGRNQQRHAGPPPRSTTSVTTTLTGDPAVELSRSSSGCRNRTAAMPTRSRPRSQRPRPVPITINLGFHRFGHAEQDFFVIGQFDHDSPPAALRAPSR